jgi:hypothetical protein
VDQPWSMWTIQRLSFQAFVLLDGRELVGGGHDETCRTVVGGGEHLGVALPGWLRARLAGKAARMEIGWAWPCGVWTKRDRIRPFPSPARSGSPSVGLLESRMSIFGTAPPNC